MKFRKIIYGLMLHVACQGIILSAYPANAAFAQNDETEKLCSCWEEDYDGDGEKDENEYSCILCIYCDGESEEHPECENNTRSSTEKSSCNKQADE